MPKKQPTMGGIVQSKTEAPKPSDPTQTGMNASSQPSASSSAYFKQLTIKLDEETYRRLKKLGAEELRSNQDIVETALKEYLDSHQG